MQWKHRARFIDRCRRSAARQLLFGGAAIVATMSTLLFLQPAASEASATVTSHFVVTGTSSNTTGDSVFLNNGATDGNPDAILFVTQNWDANGVCGCVYQPGSIGVWYDSGNSEWAVFREDTSDMAAGASFNVLAVPASSSSAFVQTSTSSNSAGDFTLIDSPKTNDKPTAMLQVTQNWNPDGVGGAYNAHTVGVWYDNGAGEWGIFNEDGTTMATGLSFNVLVAAGASNGGTALLQKASGKNIDGDGTIISNSETTGNPNTVVFVTPNWNPSGVGGTYDNNVPGVYYDGSEAQVFNENGNGMVKKSAFNLLIFSS